MANDKHNDLAIKDKSKADKWIYITPVAGVRLTNDVKNEFRIKRVILVSKAKLCRIRKRLGFPQKISDLKDNVISKDILELSDTFAIVRHSGEIKTVSAECRKIVQDELSILSTSQLGWSKRRYNYRLTIQMSHSSPSFHYLLMNSDKKRMHSGREIAGKLGTLLLHSEWEASCKNNFFFNLLSIINKKIKVDNSWRKDIERAAILIGQSQNSDDIAHAFLWNMIALELLLTRQGDKYTDVLPKRLSAFLGWFSEWEHREYSKKINEIYSKRCALVHDGKRENITASDLLFTDDILFNIINNLLEHTKLFVAKDDVITFVRKVEAEQLLGIKPKVRPKTLKFTSRSYTKEDLEKI